MMNTRIRELAEQAGFLNKDKESVEYFAELIVQECANIADVAEPYESSDLILKHFGVEE